ncbi:MAG: hypothetical protein ACRDP4_14465 [Nocardioidaceae bacterium]
MTTTGGTNLCGCGQPAKDAAICPSCQGRLTRDMRSIPGLLADLYLVLGREIRYSDHAGGRSANAPLPYDPDVSHLLWALRNTLTAWCRALGVHTAGSSAAAHHLTARVHDLAKCGDAEQATDELTWIVAQARKATDKPAYSRRWVAHCPQHMDTWSCIGDLYALIPADEAKPAVIECSRSRDHTWDTSMWARLGRRLQHCPRCHGRCATPRPRIAA